MSRMTLRSAAVMAGLALGLMAGSGHSATMPITYNIDYTVNDGTKSETVTGFIKTDGVVGTPLQQSDILSFSITSGGLNDSDGVSLSGSGLVAHTNGMLTFTFTGSSSLEFERASGGYVTAALNSDLASSISNLYAYRAVQEVVALGTVTTLGTASTVPLPNSAPLFGASLIALGAAGYAAKRRNAAAV